MDITELRRNSINKRHPWEKARAKIIRFLIQKYNSSCTHILDVGSGDAFVLSYLCSHKIGDLYIAVDTAYSKNIIESLTLTNNCSINYVQELPESISPRSNCVLLLDVLEHCENDSEILNQLHNEALTQSPIFFITVPAFQCLFSKHDKLLGHYRRYNTKTIRQLCKRSGYDIVSSGYFFTSLFLIRAIQLVLEKFGMRKPLKTVDNWNGSPIITRLLSFFLWIDFITGRFLSMIGIQLPGLSTYCICRRLPS